MCGFVTIGEQHMKSSKEIFLLFWQSYVERLKFFVGGGPHD
jgi:hypothetical protein